MAAEISPQPLDVGDPNPYSHNLNSKQSYAATIQQKQVAATTSKIELCPVSFIHGEPTVEFTMDEVNEFIREEGLHQAVILKFSYGKPEMQELRRLISTQFDVQDRCNVGQLDFRHLLIRFDLYNAYVQFLSRTTGYLKAKGTEYFFRTFPWTLQFNPKKETSIAVVWISLPGLPTNFFAKKSLLSIASAVGKVLVVDKETQERTRPSTARVKILLDLVDKHPTKVKLVIVYKATGKSVVYYQEIVYDNLPKYCDCCKHQVHDEKSCRFLKVKTGEEGVANTSDPKLPMANKSNGEQLKGDARHWLNAKRATQMLHNGGDIVKEDNIAKQVLHSGGDNTAAANSIAARDPGRVADVETRVRNGQPKAPIAIPASTVFARMHTAIVGKHNVDSNQHGQNNVADVAGQTVNVTNNRALDGQADGKHLTTPSDAQSLGSKKNRHHAINGVSKDVDNIDDGKGEFTTKMGEVWNVLTSRKSPTKKVASTGQLSPDARRNAHSNFNSSNVFAALELDEARQLEIETQNENKMSTQLVPFVSNDNDALGNEIEATDLVVRRNTSKADLEGEMTGNNSNVPTLFFSTPQVETIIKEAQAAMMSHTNMVRQPLVTMNTSDIEIPLQSENSFRKYEEESRQLQLGTGLDSEHQGSYEHSWLAKTRTWADQIEDEEEEDCGDDNERESTDYAELESYDEDLRSVVSPSLLSNQKTKLNLNAQAFIPRKSITATSAPSRQQHHEIIPSSDVISTVAVPDVVGQKHRSFGTSNRLCTQSSQKQQHPLKISPLGPQEQQGGASTGTSKFWHQGSNPMLNINSGKEQPIVNAATNNSQQQQHRTGSAETIEYSYWTGASIEHY